MEFIYLLKIQQQLEVFIQFSTLHSKKPIPKICLYLYYISHDFHLQVSETQADSK